MSVQNKLLQIEREAQQVVHLANLGAQTAVKLDLNETEINIINNKGERVLTYKNAGRKERKEANAEASNFDVKNPEDAPHVLETKSTINFKADGSVDFGDAGFGVDFPTAEINALTANIEKYTDCDNIKQLIKDELKVIEDQIKAKAPEIAMLSEINGLLSLPSNPLKILRWARKVVSKFFGPYTMAMIDLAMQLAQFAGALANLAQAASAAQSNLRLCAYEIVEDTVDDLIDSINTEISGVTGKLDDVLIKIEDAQTKIGRITGNPNRFLPNRLSGGISGLAANLIEEKRADVIKLGTETIDSFDTRQNTARQDLVNQINKHLTTAFPGTYIENANGTFTADVSVGSVKEFFDDVTAIANRDVDDDSVHPEAQADESAFANSVGQSLQGNSGFSSTLLTSAGAFSANVSIPNADTSVSGQGVNGKFEIITARGTSDQVRYQVENGIIIDVNVGLP